MKTAPIPILDILLPREEQRPRQLESIETEQYQTEQVPDIRETIPDTLPIIPPDKKKQIHRYSFFILRPRTLLTTPILPFLHSTSHGIL
jgi:hypothetical protein